VATGVQFYPPEIGALDYAITRAFELYRDPGVMRGLRRNGMRADVSWRHPAKRYAALFAKLRT
jgi:starch synthase